MGNFGRSRHCLQVCSNSAGPQYFNAAWFPSASQHEMLSLQTCLSLQVLNATARRGGATSATISEALRTPYPDPCANYTISPFPFFLLLSARQLLLLSVRHPIACVASMAGNTSVAWVALISSPIVCRAPCW